MDKTAQEIKHRQKEEASEFCKDRIEKIAAIYHEKMPLLDEFWILITGKKDLFSGKINVGIQAFDKANKPNIPIQGGQMWHIIWSSGLKELEWILPLQKKIAVGSKRISDPSMDNYSPNSAIVKESLRRANNFFGKDFLTGKDLMT